MDTIALHTLLQDTENTLSQISMAEIDRVRMVFENLDGKDGLRDLLLKQLDTADDFVCAASFKDFQRLKRKFEDGVVECKAQAGNPSARLAVSVLEKIHNLLLEEFEAIKRKPPELRLVHKKGKNYEANWDCRRVKMDLLIESIDESVPPINRIVLQMKVVKAGDEIVVKQTLAGRLEGGGALDFSVEVPITDSLIISGSSTYEFELSYVDYGNEKHFYNKRLTVQVGLVFKRITFNYCDYLSGTGKEGSLFVGREKFLERMQNLASSDSGGHSMMICGQRRAGKTSLLAEFGRRLDKRRFVYSSIELPESCGDESWDALIARMLCTELQGCERLPNNWDRQPKIDALSPKEKIVEMARQIPRGVVWCVAVDEFTHLYDWFRNERNHGRCEAAARSVRTVLSMLKSILGGANGCFHLFLAVQNSIRGFRKEFPEYEDALGEVMTLCGMEEPEIRQLVEKMDKDVKPENRIDRIGSAALSELRRATGGFPLFLLVYLNAIVALMNLMSSMVISTKVLRGAMSGMCDVGSNLELASERFQSLFKLGLEGADDRMLLKEYLKFAKGKVIPDTKEETSLCEQLKDRYLVSGDEVVGFELTVGMFRSWLNGRGRDANNLTPEDFREEEMI